MNRCGKSMYSAVVLALLSLATVIRAIEIPDDIRKQLLGGSGSAASAEEVLPSTSPTSIDNSLDSNQYVIGMGDAFDISVINTPSIGYRATINQNCDAFIPEIGVVRVGRMSLARALQVIREAVAKQLKRPGEVYVVLARGKAASVFVGGEVLKPGTYPLSGAMRVVDAIRSAHGGLLPRFNDFDYRSVRVQIGDSTTFVDLFPALFKGNNTENPYLYPGMKIFLSKTVNRIILLGMVSSPIVGTFPIRNGQTLADLIGILTFDATVDSNRIVIQSGATRSERSTQVARFSDATSITLENMMTITFQGKPNLAKYATSALRGEVMRPGEVAIIEGKTTVSDVIEMCGGLTEYADLSRIAVVRLNKLVTRSLREGAGVNGVKQMPETVVLSVRPEISASFEKFTMLNDYLVVAAGDTSLGMIVQPEDNVYVPRKDPFVYLSGSVARPGGYPYVAGKSHRYYIDQAGGYSGRASRANAYSVTQYGPAVMMKPASEVVAGDVLVVPDREPAKITRTIFLPIVQAIATTVTTIVAIVSLSITANK